MNAASESDLVRDGIDIASGAEVAAGVGAAVGDLRRTVERGAAAHDDGADGLTVMNPAGELRDGAAVEIKIAAGKAERGFVEQARRKDVRLAETDNLFAQGDVYEGERVAGGGMGGAVVDGVDGGQRVVLCEILVEARGTEVLADVL